MKYVIFFQDTNGLSMHGFAPLLGVMILCGILGGVVGRKTNKKIDNAAVDKLFIGLLTVVMFVCVYNYMQFSR